MVSIGESIESVGESVESVGVSVKSVLKTVTLIHTLVGAGALACYGPLGRIVFNT